MSSSISRQLASNAPACLRVNEHESRFFTHRRAASPIAAHDEFKVGAYFSRERLLAKPRRSKMMMPIVAGLASRGSQRAARGRVRWKLEASGGCFRRADLSRHLYRAAAAKPACRHRRAPLTRAARLNYANPKSCSRRYESTALPRRWIAGGIDLI